LEHRKFTKEKIVEWISKYKYGNINNLDYRKEIIDTFVNSVFVYDDKLVLTYNWTAPRPRPCKKLKLP